MRGVVFAGEGRVEVVDLPDPSITSPDQAVVRIIGAGICGSDLHLLHGKAPMEPGEPLGHEGAGVVEEMGADVEGVRPGDRVAIAFNAACGRCWFCRNRMSALCDDGAIFGYGIFGGGLPGTQSERLLVPNASVNLLRVPDGVPDEAAVMVGDALVTGFYGASLAEPTPDGVVAVVGCGPVGFCTILGLRSLGAGTVFGLDREPARLALAERAGAIPVHVGERNPVTVLAEATDGRGADAVIDAVGQVEAFEGAVDAVRRGGTVVVLGVYASETAQLQLGAYWARSITLRFAGLTPVLPWWGAAIEALERGEADPTPLISHRLPLERAAEGYALFDRREATKVILQP
jgi:threonine dehydrogenase-like Zn-dependent dehydrogenase